jgi:hypothetical protein
MTSLRNLVGQPVVGGGMDRRSFLTALLGTPVLAAVVAACGNDSTTPLRPRGTADSVPRTEPTATTVPPAGGIAHPTGADEVVLRFGYEGGFVAPDSLFSRTPALLITGDGHALTTGVVPAVFPGPLLTPMNTQPITEVAVQRVLSTALAAGLLTSPPSYELPSGVGIADAADTVVALAANGTTYNHRAYALDLTASDRVAETPARLALSKFVAQLGDLATLVGADQLGSVGTFAPKAYRVRATPEQPSPTADQPAPTLVAWPSSTGVALKGASTCLTIDAAKVGDVFTKATQLTYFTEDGVTYRLAVAQVLPGDPSC